MEELLEEVDELAALDFKKVSVDLSLLNSLNSSTCFVSKCLIKGDVDNSLGFAGSPRTIIAVQIWQCALWGCVMFISKYFQIALIFLFFHLMINQFNYKIIRN